MSTNSVQNDKCNESSILKSTSTDENRPINRSIIYIIINICFVEHKWLTAHTRGKTEDHANLLLT